MSVRVPTLQLLGGRGAAQSSVKQIGPSKTEMAPSWHTARRASGWITARTGWTALIPVRSILPRVIVLGQSRRSVPFFCGIVFMGKKRREIRESERENKCCFQGCVSVPRSALTERDGGSRNTVHLRTGLCTRIGLRGGRPYSRLFRPLIAQLSTLGRHGKPDATKFLQHFVVYRTWYRQFVDFRLSGVGEGKVL
ncbi:unnamed protein product [Ectocarpus sp. 8 AP-2014]